MQLLGGNTVMANATQVATRLNKRLVRLEKHLTNAKNEQAKLRRDIRELLTAIKADAKKAMSKPASTGAKRKPATRRATARRMARPKRRNIRRISTVRHSTVTRRPARGKKPATAQLKRERLKPAVGRKQTTHAHSNGKVSRKELITQAKNRGIKGSDRMSREQLETVLNPPPVHVRGGNVGRVASSVGVSTSRDSVSALSRKELNQRAKAAGVKNATRKTRVELEMALSI